MYERRRAIEYPWRKKKTSLFKKTVGFFCNFVKKDFYGKEEKSVMDAE